jgi:hypothetical protein
MASLPTSRWAVSFLSRFKKNDAKHEEMLVHKESGQVLIKTPVDGNIISFDSLSRQKNHIDTVTLMAFNLNINQGDMFLLELPFELPEIVQEDTNLIDEPVVLKQNDVKKVLISVDIEELVLGPITQLVEFEPYIKLELSFNYEDDTKSITLNQPLSKNNTNIISLESVSNLIYEPNLYNVSLTGLYILRDGNSASVNLKNLLYGILVLIE